MRRSRARRRGGRAALDGPWTELYAAIDVALPEAPRPLASVLLEKKIQVQLRLVRAARTDAPSLWVLRERGAEAIDRMLTSVPEEISARFLFAVGRADPGAAPIVVLKTRGGRGADPALDVPGEAYVPLLSLPNVYVPAGMAVEPPLRRERLRALFAPAAEEIAWLVPLGAAKFYVERIRDSAFSPLSEWVEYVAHSSAAALEPWVRSATFELEKFQSIGAEWADPPPNEDKPKPDPQSAKREREADLDSTRAISVARSKSGAKSASTTRSPTDADPAPPSGPQLTADQAALTALEHQFGELTTPLDHPERNDAWRALGQSHAALGALDEASICFAHALWEAPPDLAHQVINT